MWGHRVLLGLDRDVKAGAVLTLLDPGGAGNTTLAWMVAGRFVCGDWLWRVCLRFSSPSGLPAPSRSRRRLHRCTRLSDTVLVN
jgi:ABC-type lipopolysaccharide export system ATPase subunit